MFEKIENDSVVDSTVETDHVGNITRKFFFHGGAYKSLTITFIRAEDKVEYEAVLLGGGMRRFVEYNGEKGCKMDDWMGTERTSEDGSLQTMLGVMIIGALLLTSNYRSLTVV